MTISSRPNNEVCKKAQPSNNKIFRGKLQIHFFAVLSLLILTAILSVNALAQTVVRPSNLNGWVIDTGGTAATASFQTGPLTPPLGTGSGRFAVGSNGDDFSIFRTQAYAGTLLSDITALSYSTFAQSGGTGSQAPYFSIRVDFDGNGTSDDTLYFEPVYQNGTYGGDPVPNQCGANPNCVTYGQWQTWNAFVGGYWSFTTPSPGGPPLVTLANYIAAHPGAKVASDGLGSVRIIAGGGAGAWDNFIGNTDNFTIGISGNNTTFDFEPNAATVVTVNPSMLNGWASVSQRTATGTFVVGPPTPPLNLGSYRMATGAGNSGPNLPQGGAGQGGKTYFGTQQFDNTLLSSITNVKYSTYITARAPGTSVAPVLVFQLDTNNDGVRDNVMNFEPVYSAGTQGATTVGNWQTWDASAGRWYLKNPVGGLCAGDVEPCFYTIAQIAAAVPGIKIVNWYAAPDGRGTQFVAGQNGAGSPWNNFDGNIDAFVFETSGSPTVFDFEPGRPSVTINQAAGQADPTSTSPINFTVTFSEPVTGFDASDVTLSGTSTGATVLSVTGGPTTYNVAVTATNSGTVIANIVNNAATSISNAAPSTASTSTDNTVTFFTCNNISIPTGQTVATNNQFVSPINIDNTTGRNILGYSFKLTYNPAVVTPVAVETAGTMSAGWDTVTNNTPGILNVVVFNPPMGTPLTGAGTLLNVRFVANGGITTTSTLGLSNFILNEGVPCVVTTNGDVTVISGTISGAVTYINGPGTPGVPNTTISASGSIPLSTTTDSNGLYSLSGFGAGMYTITPSKTGQVNGITNSDATAVAQHIVGFITLNSNQLLAADVTQNGTVSSLDATYIAQYTALLPNPSFTGTWKFIPPSRSYLNVQTNQTNQDYSAILLGEVTGNWNPGGPLRQSSDQSGKEDQTLKGERPDAVVSVSLPANQFATQNTDFDIDLTVSNTTGESIFGYEFDLYYNPSVILPQAIPCESALTLSAGRSVTCNPVTPGRLRVVVFSTSGVPISGAGTLLRLKFNAIGASTTTSFLRFQNSPTPPDTFMFNEGLPQDATTDGQVTISSPSAATSSISGRVKSASGKPVSEATVILTDSNGNLRNTRTNYKGFYQFNEIPTGDTYTISVSNKLSSSAPQVITLFSDLVAVDLIF